LTILKENLFRLRPPEKILPRAGSNAAGWPPANLTKRLRF
jgi:hypothetical protein